MGLFDGVKERVLLQGIMPERALLRLKRAGIGVYNAKKVEKNQILLCVKRKDIQKVFAIYPNVCYNKSAQSAYTATLKGSAGLGKLVSALEKRVGLVLAFLVCMAITLASQPLVFKVEIMGTKGYSREVLALLDEAGIRPFAPYKEGKEDVVSAKILALDGVEYASVKKHGHRIAVEVRTSPFLEQKPQTGGMQAARTGKIIAMTVLRGTPLKKIGDEVLRGETLVGDWFSTEDGGQVRVEIIARVCTACVYACEVEAESREEAFAKAYLALNLTEADELTLTRAEESEKGYLVTLEYTAIQTMNF
ncbi:MAG: sporulation protein YqfD [Clostridia bacterium]|nr:sporulation protein YqfD [Clostridia bacterium]